MTLKRKLDEAPTGQCYCSMCGGRRVAGITQLHPLNWNFNPRRGAWEPTVTHAEIVELSEKVADPVRYFYFCWDCGKFGSCLFNGDLLRKRFPQRVD